MRADHIDSSIAHLVNEAIGRDSAVTAEVMRPGKRDIENIPVGFGSGGSGGVGGGMPIPLNPAGQNVWRGRDGAARRSPADKPENIDDVVLRQINQAAGRGSGAPIPVPDYPGEKLAGVAGGLAAAGTMAAIGTAPLGSGSSKSGQQTTAGSDKNAKPTSGSTPPPAPPQLGQFNRMAGAATTGANVTPKNYDRMAGLAPLGSKERPFPGGDPGPVRSLSPAASAPVTPAASAPVRSVTAPAASAPVTPAASTAAPVASAASAPARSAPAPVASAGLPSSVLNAVPNAPRPAVAPQAAPVAPQAATAPQAVAPTPTGVRSGINTNIDADTRARALASVANLPPSAPTLPAPELRGAGSGPYGAGPDKGNLSASGAWHGSEKWGDEQLHKASKNPSADSIDLKEDWLARILTLSGQKK